ncbi:MAG: CotH kinase family protein [Oscillospiraceae bacterium]|nr:CotH kinase family protein [Oscillospiraceae bacterium]
MKILMKNIISMLPLCMIIPAVLFSCVSGDTDNFDMAQTNAESATVLLEETKVYNHSINNGLPVVVIDTQKGQQITRRRAGNDIPAYIRITDPDEIYGEGLYEGHIEIRGRGNSSWGMPKKSYNFQLAAPTRIFDMYPSTSWMLSANYSDKSLMRNYTAYEFARDLGAEFAAENRFVDLVLNGEYMGTYTLGERIRAAPGRLDLPRLRADTTDSYELSGTYILEINSTDKYDADEIIFMSETVKNTHFWSVRQPGSDSISDAAFRYIESYILAAEAALFGENFKDPTSGYRVFIDTASFIDWYIVNEFYKNVDAGFHTSVYFYKPRGGKLHMGPVWDFDLGAGNADYAGCDDPEGWYVRNSAWFIRLFSDESFALEFKERWNYIKNNGYFEVFFNRIDETAEIIKKSAEANFKKWQILGEYVWPNASLIQPVWERTSYQSEIDYLKLWLELRFEWLDAEINK